MHKSFFFHFQVVFMAPQVLRNPISTPSTYFGWCMVSSSCCSTSGLMYFCKVNDKICPVAPSRVSQVVSICFCFSY